MNYQEALSFLEYTNKLGSVLGLGSIARLLEGLGNPEKDLKFIHIGGTNGKGSTSSFLSNILLAGGYRVGLFTSPHMIKFNESIVVDGEEIRDEDFARLMEEIKTRAAHIRDQGYDHPTSFEIITALSFLYFKEKKVDYVVLEVGLGGRDDSTNIIPPPLVSVFTSIDYDHLDILGSSLEEIARVKSGIIKENSLVISYPQKDQIIEILKKVALENKSPFYLCDLDRVSGIKISDKGSEFDFSYGDMDLKGLKISMLGEYQIYNASLAISTVLILREKGLLEIEEDQIRQGLIRTRWAARLEVLHEGPKILIDGAHNLQGIIQLKKALGIFTYDRLILTMGILKDKDFSHMVEEIAPLAHMIIATEVDNPRKLDAKDLAQEISKYNKNLRIEKNIDRAVELAMEEAGDKDLLVFCGSLYLMGQIREKVKLL